MNNLLIKIICIFEIKFELEKVRIFFFFAFLLFGDGLDPCL